MRSAVANADDVAIGVVPANETRTSRLPESRIRRVRDHVRELVDIVEKRRKSGRSLRGVVDDRDSAADASAAALGQACASCRGHCCLTGGDHAYLDSTDVERFWATRPKASAASIVRAYVAALPERTYSGSCVFHATGGCTLPREMRGNLCNVFLCDGTRELRRRLEESGAREAFVVATKDSELLRATHVDANGKTRRAPKR